MKRTKRLITVTAGRLVHCVCYTQSLMSDSPKARAEKTKCSSAARKKLNFRYSYEKLQLSLAANFKKHDLFVTLTYDDEHLPLRRKDANERLGRFLRKLRESRRQAGDVLTYIYSTHELMGPGVKDSREIRGEDSPPGSRRLHHHLVINAGEAKRDYELIRSLWDQGSNIDIQQICNTEHYVYDDFLELAMYMTRERNPEAPPAAVGAKSWTSSRNLKKPIRESLMVDEKLTVEAPPGAFVLDVDEKRNEFGSFKYIKYLLPERKSSTRKNE